MSREVEGLSLGCPTSGEDYGPFAATNPRDSAKARDGVARDAQFRGGAVVGGPIPDPPAHWHMLDNAWETEDPDLS